MEYYRQPPSDTLHALDSTPDGLTPAQAAARLARDGRNVLTEPPKPSLVKRFFQQLADPMILVLLAAALISAITSAYAHESFADVIIILIVVIINAVLGVYQESKAEQAIAALKELSAAHSRVLRGGKLVTVPSEELVVGVTILMKAVGVGKAYIGIENNKPDAIAFLRELSKHYEGVRVTPLKVRYPQGGEKQLIAAVTGRQVPPPPGLPIDVGAVVCNASTTVAVYEAVQKRKPLVERIVTVTGKGMKTPSNYLVRMGTPIASLVEAAGGLPEGDVKVLNGGPMMGRAMVDLSSPVTKGCSGITVLGGAEAQRGAESACIKCAKCVQACPMGLEPYLLSKLSRKQLWERLEGEEVTSCIECGCCQFTCPADLPLLDYIRLGKQRVMGLIRARAAANAPKK